MKVAATALALILTTTTAQAHVRHHHHHSRHHCHHSVARHHRADAVSEIAEALGRPFHQTGELVFGALHVAFGSGGVKASIPYGTYPITPDAVGDWGSRHKAIGLAGGEIWDAGLGRVREGIELHASDSGRTEGCVGVPSDQFGKLRKKILAAVDEGTKLLMHVSAAGIQIDEAEAPAP